LKFASVVYENTARGEGLTLVVNSIITKKFYIQILGPICMATIGDEVLLRVLFGPAFRPEFPFIWDKVPFLDLAIRKLSVWENSLGEMGNRNDCGEGRC
jgi:hypothetical protein